MNKTGKMIIIVVAIVVLSLFEVLFIKGLAGQKQMINICVAKVDIAQNSLITEKMLALQSFPSDSLPAFAVRNQQELVGKFSIIVLKEGEVITSTRIVIDDERLVKSKGKVFISLMPTPEDALGWQISKGSFVDLLCYKDDLNFELVEFKQIKIVDLVDTSYKRIKDEDLDRKPKYLIVEVTPQQAKEITMWKAIGKIAVVGKGAN